MNNKEYRYRQAPEIRADEGDDGPSSAKRLTGYAAVFGKKSLDLGGFREKIHPGAFDLSTDVYAFLSHDPSLVLGRKSAQTLSLIQDDIGLKTEIILPETTYAQDLWESVRRGDVSHMSFGFRPRQEEWEDEGDDIPTRILTDIELFEISPVALPAYPATSIDARAILNNRNQSHQAMRSRKSDRGRRINALKLQRLRIL